MIIRRNEDGTIDEVLGEAHLEDMGGGDWSLIFADPCYYPGRHMLLLSLRGPLVVVEESEVSNAEG